jgi:hypothetical protein
VTLITSLMIFIALAVGAVAGAALFAWRLRILSDAPVRLPKTWPLAARSVITNQEHEVLIWLLETFSDHLVMIKLPVLRFTMPVDKEKNGGGKKLQDMLGGVYCSFTVCTTEGNVVGCVDVVGRRGIGKANRELKESLLMACDVAYTVIRSGSLPKGSDMRAAFLGEGDVDNAIDSEIDSEMGSPVDINIDTRLEPNSPVAVSWQSQASAVGENSFVSDLDSFTRARKLAAKQAALKQINKTEAKAPPRTQPAGFNLDGSGAIGSGKLQRFPTQFEDSFLHVDESRPAKLK